MLCLGKELCEISLWLFMEGCGRLVLLGIRDGESDFCLHLKDKKESASGTQIFISTESQTSFFTVWDVRIRVQVP